MNYTRSRLPLGSARFLAHSVTGPAIASFAKNRANLLSGAVITRIHE